MIMNYESDPQSAETELTKDVFSVSFIAVVFSIVFAVVYGVSMNIIVGVVALLTIPLLRISQKHSLAAALIVGVFTMLLVSLFYAATLVILNTFIP